MPKALDSDRERRLIPNGRGYQIPDPDEGLREHPRYNDKDYDTSDVEWSPYPTLNNNTKEAAMAIEAVVRRFRQQKNQAGEAKMYSRKNYTENKADIKHQSKMRYTRIKNKPDFQKRRKLYKQKPEKFERRPPGFKSPSQRSKDWRKKQKRSLTKVAMSTEDILQGIKPSIVQDALTMKVGKPRIRDGVSQYSVDSPSGKTYRVHVSMDGENVHLSCDCPFWQWQGPEHWAVVNGYLYGKPVGTASRPVFKDPNSEHRVCKHAVAVFNRLSR